MYLKFSNFITLAKLHPFCSFILYVQLFIVQQFSLHLCACLHFSSACIMFFTSINTGQIPVPFSLHIFLQFYNSNMEHNYVPPVQINNIILKYLSTVVGRFMSSCSLTGNRRNHRLNHLLSAPALVHTPWPLSGFSPGLSLWPISRRLSGSICPAPLVCDPVTKTVTSGTGRSETNCECWTSEIGRRKN